MQTVPAPGVTVMALSNICQWEKKIQQPVAKMPVAFASYTVYVKELNVAISKHKEFSSDPTKHQLILWTSSLALFLLLSLFLSLSLSLHYSLSLSPLLSLSLS